MRFNKRTYRTLPPLSPHSTPRGEFELEHFDTLHGALAHQKNTQATGAAHRLRYNGSVGITLSEDPQPLELALGCRNGMPALRGHYLAEMLPRIGAPADTEHFVSAGQQLLPLTDHANLEPGDILGIAAAPLMHIPLGACVTEPAAQNATSPAESVHCVDEPYLDLTSAAPPQVHTVDPAQSNSDPPAEVLQRLSPDSRNIFLQIWHQLPPHLRDINFDLHGPGWEPAVIRELSDVLLQFQDHLSRSKTDLGHCKTLPFEVTLQPGVSPISSRPYRTNPILTKKVNAILDAYLGAGLIQHSSSSRASPLVALPQKDGNIRITVNYQPLNRVTVVGKLPIPHNDEVFDSLGEGKIFSTYDLASGLFQNAIHPNTVPLTAFCTSSGLYEWLRMRQGAATASGCFQRLMQRVIEVLEHIIMYLDDAIAFDASPVAYIRTLREFLSRLRTHDLKLSPSKARLDATELKFLGRSISTAGLHPDTIKVREGDD